MGSVVDGEGGSGGSSTLTGKQREVWVCGPLVAPHSNVATAPSVDAPSGLHTVEENKGGTVGEVVPEAGFEIGVERRWKKRWM